MVLLPEKELAVEFQSDMEAVKQEIKNRFENDGSYRYTSSGVSHGDYFCISRKLHIFNFLKKKIMLAEIRGEVKDQVVYYKLGISPSMRFVFLLDVFFLGFIAVGYFGSDELQAGFTLLAIIIASILFFRFRLKREVDLLEGELQDRLGHFD